MHRVLAPLILALALASCVLPPEHPEIPQTPAAPPPEVEPPPIPPEILPEAVVHDLTFRHQEIAYAPPQAPLAPPRPAAKAPGKPVKPPPEPTPQQIIVEAQRQARMAPTKRGYHGGRGVHRFLWSPGKIYDVYLSPGQATKIELPSGETMAHALMLNPKSFDVATATVGNELTATSIILIRPCAQGEGECVPSPDVDVALTSASGRSYDLHLIIGKVGMVGVQWELVFPTQLQVEEPGMLPRRSQP